MTSLSSQPDPEPQRLLAQADFLVANACDGLQGFLFARSMSLAGWLERRLAPLHTD